MSLEASQIVDQIEASTTQALPQENTGASTDANPSTQAPTEDPKVSSRLEVLIKREQAAVQREKAAKFLEAQNEASAKDIAAFRELKDKKDIRAILEAFELSPETVAQGLVELTDNSPDSKLKLLENKLEQFRASQEEAEKRRLEESKKANELQEQKAISDFKSEIKTYLKDNAARYELISFEEQENLVFDVIEEQYRRTLDTETGVGKVLSVAEAADKVEAFLEEKYNKSRGLSKVKALWSAVPKELLQNAAKQEAKPSQKPMTLTNNLSATPQHSKRPLTDDEKVRVAIANVLGRKA